MATMCKYGNCCEYETSISLNGCGYRLRFCSWLHAAGGALGHASYAQRGTCPEAYDLIVQALKLLEQADKIIFQHESGMAETAEN